jgi:uncharacterized coiled-coil protein SlyX
MHHQCTTARTDIRELTERVRGLEGEKTSADAAIAELKSVIASKKAEADRERKRKERLENSLKGVKASVEERQQQIRAKQASVAEGNEELRQSELSLREQKQSTDRALKEADTLSLKVQKLTAELEERTRLNSGLHAENVQRAAELKHAEAEIEGVRKEVMRHDKLRQAVLDKVAAVEAKRTKADDHRDELKVLIAAQVALAIRAAPRLSQGRNRYLRTAASCSNRCVFQSAQSPDRRVGDPRTHPPCLCARPLSLPARPAPPFGPAQVGPALQRACAPQCGCGWVGVCCGVVEVRMCVRKVVGGVVSGSEKKEGPSGAHTLRSPLR